MFFPSYFSSLSARLSFVHPEKYSMMIDSDENFDGVAKELLLVERIKMSAKNLMRSRAKERLKL